jgi:hypothetical protein
LFYPDLSISPVLFIKRIKADLFYDYAENIYKSANNETVFNFPNSTGVDITADFYPFRMIFPFEAGLRSIYFPGSRNISYQLVFNINLNNF